MDLGTVPNKPLKREKMQADGKITLTIAPPTTATAPISFDTDLTSGTMRRNIGSGTIYDWQRIALSLLPLSASK